MTMRYYPNKTGPFPIGVFFEHHEIESMALSLLEKTGCLPTGEPAAIDVDNVLHRAFKASPDFDDLAAQGCHGKTTIYADGTFELVIDRQIAEDGKSERRYRSTLAHEIGHIELHRPLLLRETYDVFTPRSPCDSVKILCRDCVDSPTPLKYGGEWWEYQANRFMSALLMPKRLVVAACAKVRADTTQEESTLRDRMVEEVSMIFNVSREAGSIRMKQLKICDDPQGQCALGL